MSRTTPHYTPDKAEIIQKVEQNRDDLEALSDRDDVAGAMARVFLAIADGKTPSKADCEAAGVPTLYELAKGDDR